LRYGGLIVELAALVSASAVAEGAVLLTAHTFVAVEVEVVVDTEECVAIFQNAPSGDEEDIRAVSILGRLLDLSGDLLVHAHRFERNAKP
jgi:hypothetical protein